MIKFIIAYDDNEKEDLSIFFKTCAQELIARLNLEIHEFIEWNHTNKYLNEIYIDIFLNNIPYTPFVFLSYSHGSEDSLVGENLPYLSVRSNLDAFKNSLFYTFSCSSGKLLGQKLLEKGCTSFIGYKNDIFFAAPYLAEFVECSNSGIYSLLNGENVAVALRIMLDTHNKKIDELYQDNFFVASVIRDNRDSLIHYGNKDAKIDDFAFGQ